MDCVYEEEDSHDHLHLRELVAEELDATGKHRPCTSGRLEPAHHAHLSTSPQALASFIRRLDEHVRGPIFSRVRAEAHRRCVEDRERLGVVAHEVRLALEEERSDVQVE